MSLFQSIFPVGLGFFAWPAVVSSLPRCGVPAHAKLRGTIAGEGKEEQHRVLHLFSPALMSTVDEPNPSSPEMVLPGSRSLCVEAFHSIVCYSQSLLMVYIRQQQADCQKWSLPNFLSQHFGKSRYTHLLGIRTSWSSKAGHAIFHGPKRELSLFSHAFVRSDPPRSRESCRSPRSEPCSPRPPNRSASPEAPRRSRRRSGAAARPSDTPPSS